MDSETDQSKSYGDPCGAIIHVPGRVYETCREAGEWRDSEYAEEFPNDGNPARVFYCDTHFEECDRWAI